MSGILGGGGRLNMLEVLDLHYEPWGWFGRPLGGQLDVIVVPAKRIDVHGQNGDGYGGYALEGLWTGHALTTQVCCYECGNLGTLGFPTWLKHIESGRCQRWFAPDWWTPGSPDFSACPDIEHIDLAGNDRLGGVILPANPAKLGFLSIQDTQATMESVDDCLAKFVAAGRNGGQFYAGHWDPWGYGPRPSPPSPGSRVVANASEGHLLAGLTFTRQGDARPDQWTHWWKSDEQRDQRDWYLWGVYGPDPEGGYWYVWRWFITDYEPGYDPFSIRWPGESDEYWELRQAPYSYGPYRTVNALNGDGHRYEAKGLATGDPFDVDFSGPTCGIQNMMTLTAPPRNWTVMVEEFNW